MLGQRASVQTVFSSQLADHRAHVAKLAVGAQPDLEPLGSARGSSLSHVTRDPPVRRCTARRRLSRPQAETAASRALTRATSAKRRRFGPAVRPARSRPRSRIPQGTIVCEAAQVGGDVQREAVGGDPAGGEPDADGGELLVADPDPGQARLPPGASRRSRRRVRISACSRSRR